jgi:hypothetical protein
MSKSAHAVLASSRAQAYRSPGWPRLLAVSALTRLTTHLTATDEGSAGGAHGCGREEDTNDDPAVPVRRGCASVSW